MSNTTLQTFTRLLSLFSVALMIPASTFAVDIQWDSAVTGGGDWSLGTNWDLGTPADGVGEVADFSLPNFPNGDIPFTLDQNVTLGGIDFGNDPSFVILEITPSGSETITLNNGTGTSAIDVNTREGARIFADIGGTEKLVVNVGAFASANSSNTVGLQLSGQNTYSGGTEVQSGLLTLGSSSVGAVTSGPVGTGTLTMLDGTTLGSVGADQTIANEIELNGTVQFGHFNRDVVMTGDVTLLGNTTVVQQSGTFFFYQVRFQGNIGEDASGRSLTLSPINNAANQDVYLEGDNSYTGDTTVTGFTGSVFDVVHISGDNSLATGNFIVEAGGFVELESINAISDSSSVFLETDTTFFGVLDMEADVTVDSLFLDDIQQIAGTYGATGSGAANIFDDYFDGSSILTVLSSPVPNDSVPEPSTAALLVFSIGLMTRFRRRSSRV